MSKSPANYLLHIIDECDYLLSTFHADMAEKDFLTDDTLKRAAVRSLEIIGEASKKITPETREAWPERGIVEKHGRNARPIDTRLHGG